MSTGAHFVRKRLRTGIVWYVYAWRGGPQVHKSEGATKPKLSPAVLKAIVAAQEKREVRDETTLRSLIREWRSRDPNRPSSPEWSSLAPSTQRTWGSALDRIEEKWGEVPLSVFNDARMTAKVVAWRDSRRENPRAADIGVGVLKALLAFGRLRGKVAINIALGIPSLYKGGDRAEIIWTPDELDRFHAKALEMNMLAASDGLRLAAATGLRRDDLVTLTWDEIKQAAILKKAKKRSRGKRRFAEIIRLPELDTLIAELESRPRQENVTRVLVDSDGAPWTPDRLSKAVAKVRDEIGIFHVDTETGVRRTKHLHDARGTFATKLMISMGLNDPEVAEMMAWSPEAVSRIRHVYVDQTAKHVAKAARLREAV